MAAVEQLIADHLAAQNRRGLAQDNRAKVTPCDGTDADLVKKYLRELELIPLEHRFDVFEYTARDGLLREGVFYGQQHPDPAWQDFKEHIIKAFVSQDAEGALKKELYQITKQPYETVVSYNRRFRDLTNEAYPREHNAQGQALPRNPDQLEILLKIYGKGLKDTKLANKMITPDWPETLEQAMERTALTEKKSDNLQRIGYTKPEPMEIDLLCAKPAAKAVQPPSKVEKDLFHLKAQYGKLEAKMDKLLGKAFPKPENAAPVRSKPVHAVQERRGPAPGQKGNCHYCGKPGHFIRECRKKQWDNRSRSAPPGPMRPGAYPGNAVLASRQ
jgi:hypothetical protein